MPLQLERCLFWNQCRSTIYILKSHFSYNTVSDFIFNSFFNLFSLRLILIFLKILGAYHFFNFVSGRTFKIIGMNSSSSLQLNSNSSLADVILVFLRASGLQERIAQIVKEAVSDSLQPSQKPFENSEDSAYYTRAELCQLAHITESTLWRLEKAGIIKKIKLGRKNLYSRLDVEALLGSGGFRIPAKKKRKEVAK